MPLASYRPHTRGADLSLEPVNKPRLNYNQFYLVEKGCAFGHEMSEEAFEPLAMIDRDYFRQRFQLLELSKLA